MKPILTNAIRIALLCLPFHFTAFAQCEPPVVEVSEDFEYHCLGDSLFAAIPGIEFFSCEESSGDYTYCYGNNENTVFTYCPDSPGDGTAIMLNMIAGSFENGFDTITIFDGPDTDSPVLGTHEGSVAGISYLASNPSGCLTFRIDSDFTVSCQSSSQTEFEYNISCGQLEDLFTVNWEPAAMVSNPNSLSTEIVGLTHDQAFTLTVAQIGNPDCFTEVTVNVTYEESIDLGQPGILDLCSTFDPVELISGLNGTPDNSGFWLDSDFMMNSSTFTPANDESGTYYYSNEACPDQFTPVVVTNYDPPQLSVTDDFNYVCEGEDMAVNIINEIDTDPCSESSGNYEYCYSDNEEMLFTYCPDEIGSTPMSIQFLAGSLELNADYIVVLDGDNADAPVLGELNGNIAGNAFTATNPGGCISFLMTSNGNISCETSLNIDELQWLVSCAQLDYPYTVQWEDSQFLQSPNSESTNIFGLTEDQEFTVTVAISAVPECATQESVNVTFVDNINIGMDTELTVCEGSDVLNLSDELDGDPEPVGVWTDSEGNIITGTYDPVPGTIEIFYYTNPNCTNSTELVVSTGVLPDVSAGPDVAICSGESATLQATGANSFEWVGFAPGNPIVVTPFEQTTYTVIGSDLFGCTSTDEVTITVLGGEGLEITEEDGFLTVSASSGIQWYLNGLPILGANQSSIPINYEGTYSVVVDSGGECGEVESAPYEVIFPGIASLQNKMNIYPNPSVGLFNISAENGISMLSVFSLDGRKVAEQDFNNDKNVQLDLRGNAAGLYTAKITLNSGLTETVLIQIQ